MRIIEDVKLDYKDVLVCPKRSTLKSRKDVVISRKFEFRDRKSLNQGILVDERVRILDTVPLIAANMDGVGTLTMAKELASFKVMTALHKHYSIPELKKFFKAMGPDKSKYVFFTIGLSDVDFDKLVKFSKEVSPDLLHNICIDVANGYTERFAGFVKKVRDHFPDKIIMAGNVVTGEMVEQLILSGADIVKIGIGPGSSCLTRKMAGVGYPQLSAVMECADAAHGMGGRICADGGCQVPGDVVKAFGAGADFVMVGGMLSGHEESEEKIITKGGKKYIRFYGSSSAEAMKRHGGVMPEYRSSEGREVDVPYRGPVCNTILEIEGGIRSACTYVGARNIKELGKCVTFIKVNRQLNSYFDELK